MADNYIERQFEQYQAKKAAWQKPLKHTSKKTNSKRVFITGGANGIGKAIVKAFRQKNYPVAFCDKDETSGLQTAKETVNPEKPDVPLNKNDAFQKVQKRHVQEKR